MMGLSSTESGNEQFEVRTRVNGELIKAQPICDPFIRTRVVLRGIGHAWRALTKGIEIQLAVDGSHGAQAAVMSLDAQELQERTNIFLEEMSRRRSANASLGLLGECMESDQAKTMTSSPSSKASSKCGAVE